MCGRCESTEVANVFECVPRVTGESIAWILEAQSQHVPARRRELGSDDDENAVVVALKGFGIDIVVIGNHHELRSGRARSANDVVRTPGAIRQRRVDVNDSGHADKTVGRRLALHALRLPQRDTKCRSHESHERDRDGDLHPHE